MKIYFLFVLPVLLIPLLYFSALAYIRLRYVWAVLIVSLFWHSLAWTFFHIGTFCKKGLFFCISRLEKMVREKNREVP